MLVGGISILNGHITAEQLTKFILYSEWLIFSTWWVGDNLSSLMQSVGASEKVFQLMDLSSSDQFTSKGKQYPSLKSLALIPYRTPLANHLLERSHKLSSSHFSLICYLFLNQELSFKGLWVVLSLWMFHSAILLGKWYGCFLLPSKSFKWHLGHTEFLEVVSP